MLMLMFWLMASMVLLASTGNLDQISQSTSPVTSTSPIVLSCPFPISHSINTTFWSVSPLLHLPLLALYHL
jgi:hypothetical protein